MTHPCAPRFNSQLTVPVLGLVDLDWDTEDNMPCVYAVTSSDGAIRWHYPGGDHQVIEESMMVSGFFDEHQRDFYQNDTDVSISFFSAAREPGGTPISELSGRPGEPGYDEWLRISASWGHD